MKVDWNHDGVAGLIGRKYKLLARMPRYSRQSP